MPKVIIFDFDGTLADSLNIMIESYNQAAKIYGCRMISGADLQQIRRMHLRDVLAYLEVPYLKLPFIIFSMQSYYKKQAQTLDLFEDVPAMLCRLMVAGHRLFILSTSAPDAIRLVLQEHNIDFFQGIYSCGHHMFAKGVVLKKILASHGFEPQEVYYVGDEIRDVEAARQVGMHSVAVSWGYNAHDKLKEQKPDVMIENPLDLLRYF